MNLDILFIGMLFPREKEEEIKSKMKSGMQDAANSLQWNIIDGLDANNCGTIQILDYLPISSYPRGYTDCSIEEFVFQHSNKYNSDDKVVGCTNLSVIKHFINVIPFKAEVKKWTLNNKNKKKILFIYTASPMFLTLAKYAKKYNESIQTVCVIADIPEFINAKELHGLAKIFNNYETRKSASLYRYVDKFVLLTKQMADKLKLTAPFIVMEGIATNLDAPSCNRLAEQYKNEKFVLYSGILNYKFGIGILIEAFSKIEDPDLKLLFCGFGEAEEAIKEKQKLDKRIVFLGKVDRKEVLDLQRNATILVNPRQNNEEFTKYSFPSKNLEYLSSGVPVVAYKLDGIPDEYDEYLNYPENDSPEALAQKITTICMMESAERYEKGKRGQGFVFEHKNNVAQAKRILDFLKK